MPTTDPKFKIGDSVKVKKGVLVPDYQRLCIEGWQGRVTEFHEGRSPLIGIQWDSVTLRSMPREYVEECETEGYDYSEMGLSVDDVVQTSPRDSAGDVERAQEELAQSVSWLALGEEGRRIKEVLTGIDEDDEWEAFKRWEAHLRDVIAFPLDARVAESQGEGPLDVGDRISVTGIAETVDLYGIIVDLKHGRKRYQFPLCDLEVVDKKSRNYQPVKDYAVWFANR